MLSLPGPRVAAGTVVFAHGAPARPRSLASSGQTLFVANSDAARVEFYDAEQQNGAPLGVITSGVIDPYNVAVDASGTLYVQNGNNTITEYPRGQTTPSTTLSVTSPSGNGTYVAVGPDGSVYSTNRGENEIYVWAPGSTQITNILGLAQGDLPTSVIVDAKNDIYAGYESATTPGHAGVWYFPSGNPTGHDLGITVTYAGAIALDSSGNLLLGDAGTKRVDVFKPGKTTPFRHISTAPLAPYQVALDANDTHLYVAGGQPTHVAAYDYATGAHAWNVENGARGRGFTLGVGVDTGAP